MLVYSMVFTSSNMSLLYDKWNCIIANCTNGSIRSFLRNGKNDNELTICLENGTMRAILSVRTMKKLTANITMLLLATATLIAGQPIVSESGPVSSTVTLRVIIPVKSKIISETKLPLVTITASDIKRGVKDIPAAASLTVWSNSPGGFMLQTRLGPVLALDGQSTGEMIVLAKTSGSTDMTPLVNEFRDVYRGQRAPDNRTRMSICLKLLINAGIKPGVYQIDPEFAVSSL